METRIIVLKLVLDELGVPTLDDNELEVHNAIYNVNRNKDEYFLGYTFGIYSEHRFSQSLSRDYAILVECLHLGERDYQEYELIDSLKNRLKSTKEAQKIL